MKNKEGKRLPLLFLTAKTVHPGRTDEGERGSLLKKTLLLKEPFSFTVAEAAGRTSNMEIF